MSEGDAASRVTENDQWRELEEPPSRLPRTAGWSRRP
jgi:hypothetical protein